MAPSQDDFPWHLGVYDAHCHPTDTMSSIPSIPAMKARVLTIMATRAEDQTLVEQAANQHGVASIENEAGRVIPCFGWHPWFSHHMFDDSKYEGKTELSEEEKVSHYQAVLSPRKQEVTDSDRALFLALPAPRPLSQFINQTREYLTKLPSAMVGEVGMDRSFRIPQAWQPEEQERRDDTLTPGGREGRRLSPFRVDLQHQKQILLAQLRLAAEMKRAVSLHGVQAHGILFETVHETWKGFERKVPSKRERKRQAAGMSESQEEAGNPETDDRPYPPRVCLHSYSGNASALRQWLDPAIPVDVFVSLSSAINLSDRNESTPENIQELIKAIPDDKLLVESDLHIAGDIMDAHLEDIVRRVCEVKEWSLESGVERLGNNWKRFAFGSEK